MATIFFMILNHNTCGVPNIAHGTRVVRFLIRAESSSAAAVMVWHPRVIRNWSSTTAVTTRAIAVGRPAATRATDHVRMGEIMTSRDHYYYYYY